jgi:hypothetical protein
MKNYIRLLTLGAYLAFPSSIYPSLNNNQRDNLSYLKQLTEKTAKMPSIEASSLSQLDENDLEERISRLPLPDNLTREELMELRKQKPKFEPLFKDIKKR